MSGKKNFCKPSPQDDTPLTYSPAKYLILHLLTLPFSISRKYGLFPLALVKETLELHFCWKCLFTSLTYLLLLSSPCLYQILSEEDIQKVYNVLGYTERITNAAVNASIEFFDTLCVLKLLLNRERIKIFFAALIAKVVQLLDNAIEHRPVMSREFKQRKNRLNFVIVCVILLSCISCGISFFFYSGIALRHGLVWWKIAIINILTLYWVVISQIRLLTFHMWIALIICFKIAFESLRVVTSPKNGDGLFLKRQKIKWAIREYYVVEEFLKEFHALFSFQFLNICFTTLVYTVKSCFHLIKLRQNEINLFEISSFISLICGLLSIKVTLFALCDVCNGMTTEAIRFVLNFREISCTMQYPTDILEKVIPLYTSVLSNPPKISPGKFFTIGRHMLSSVFGLIATYLVVLQQFYLQEKLLRATKTLPRQPSL